MKEEKTNVMRLLDAKKIYYRPLDYSLSGAISGTDAADALFYGDCDISVDEKQLYRDYKLIRKAKRMSGK